MGLNTLGISGGNGVILHPFRRGNLLGNIESRSIFHTENEVQWNLNFNVSMDKSLDIRYPKHGVDFIVGAPDCGHSSVMSYSRAKKLANPKDNKSLTDYFDGVNYYKPKMFLLENLPKMLDNFEGGIDDILPDYRLLTLIGGVNKWGNSQVTRTRLLVIGLHKDYPSSILNYFNTDADYELKTCGELLRGLGSQQKPDLCHVRELDEEEICLWYKGESKISINKARKLWMNKYSDLKKWPVNQGNLKNQPGVYRNFTDDYPLTVRKQNRQFNPEGYMLSPREMARIQGIPDSFKLWYNPNRHLYCINKARATVAKSPPYEIGSWFFNIINKLTLKNTI
jgi:site-specific DNA-cytosine methylase